MLKKPFILNQNSQGRSLIPIAKNQSIFNEIWLQNILENHPEILPVGEVEPVFSPLVSIGRETRTDTGGYIDNLFISPDGYITFAETKLWRNPEAGRDVLSQVIDYASSISEWTYGDLNRIVRDYSWQKTSREVDLVDWVKGHHVIDPIDFEKKVSKNLKRGRFLVLIVGDRIREEIINYLDRALGTTKLGINITFIELCCFTQSEEEEWPLFIVPFIPKQTEVIQHHIPTGSQMPEVRSSSQLSKKTTRSRRTTMEKLTDQQYWQQLEATDSQSVPLTRELIEYISGIRNISIELEKTSIVAKYAPIPMTLFYIHTDGALATRPSQIQETLEKKGFDPGVMGNYKGLIRDTLGMGGNIVCKEKITDVDVEEFKKGVTALIDRIQSFKRK